MLEVSALPRRLCAEPCPPALSAMPPCNIALRLSAVLISACGALHADIVWVGGLNDDIFEEANWDFSNSTLTQVDPNTAVLDNILIKDAPAPIDVFVAGIQTDFEIGDGFVMTVDNSTIFTSSNDGLGGQSGGGAGATIRVINGGDVATFFVATNSHMQIDSTSSAHLVGGATPINGSTIDLTEGAVLALVNETPADFLAEHKSKVSVNGQPLVVGSNVTLVSDGASGCVIEAFATAATPRNGIGLNPQDYHALNLPVLGSTWNSQVINPPTIGVTLLAFGVAPSAAPPASTPFPFGAGELLIDISVFPFLDIEGGVVPSGLHALTIPNDPLLAGMKLYTQAVRIEVVPGVDIIATALNAIDLVLGS